MVNKYAEQIKDKYYELITRPAPAKKQTIKNLVYLYLRPYPVLAQTSFKTQLKDVFPHDCGNERNVNIKELLFFIEVYLVYVVCPGKPNIFFARTIF